MNAALRAPLMSALLRSRAVRDLTASLVAYLIAGVLLAIALGFLVATLYMALTRVVERPLAALLTSLVLGVVAGLVLLVVRLPRRRRVPAGTVGVEALLLSVTDQVRRDPWSSIVIAAALGAIAEVSRSASRRASDLTGGPKRARSGHQRISRGAAAILTSGHGDSAERGAVRARAGLWQARAPGPVAIGIHSLRLLRSLQF